MELKGIEHLRRKLEEKRPGVLLRYKQYDMKHKDNMMGITIPPHIRELYRASFGWCTKAVDSLADRLIFREFKNDIFNMNTIFNANNPDIFFDSAILSALISSCCFVYISRDPENDIPRLQVIDGANATGEIDPISGLLNEGYAVLERDKNGKPVTEAYFTPGMVEIFVDGKSFKFPNAVKYCLLVPIIYRPDAVRPFGRSRISKAAMYFQAFAKRTMERSDITAEFYSFPQKYIVGLSQDAELMDKWQATISTLLQFTKDEQGDSPKLGQFTTPSMSPFTEQLRTAVAGFAGETGLTLDDLGFITDNPSSADAIKASHESLRIMARKAQRNFGSGLSNVGFVASCLRDEFTYERKVIFDVKPKWENLFELDTSALSGMGDVIAKIHASKPDYLDDEKLYDLLGF